MKLRRLILAAVIGGIYAVCAAVLEFNGGFALGLLNAFLGAACAAVMVWIGFCARGSEVVKASFAYAAVNVGLGGVMTALYSFAGRAADFIGVQSYDAGAAASPVFFTAAALISGAVSLVYGKYREKSGEKEKVGAILTFQGKSLPLTLLSDSGNLLREPFSGRPVVVVSEKSLGEILPEGIYLSETSEISAISQLRGRYMTVSGVAGRNMLICFSPDEISVEGRTVDAAVAIDGGSAGYGGCDGIIPKILLNT